VNNFLLNNNENSLDDMKSLQNDVTSENFKRFRFVFEKIPSFNDKVLELWRNKLINWDGVESLSSKEASVFEHWYFNISSITIAETGKPFPNDLQYKSMFFEKIFTTNSDKSCDLNNLTCLEFASNILSYTINHLIGVHGDIPEWGSIHYADFPHHIFESTLLNCLMSRKIGTSGGVGTVNVAEFEDYLDNKFHFTLGPTYRQIIDYDKSKNISYFMNIVGQSGNPFSIFYDNMLTKWRNGEYLNIEMNFQKTSMYSELYLWKKE
jgi:penicillin G amidase